MWKLLCWMDRDAATSDSGGGRDTRLVISFQSLWWIIVRYPWRLTYGWSSPNRLEWNQSTFEVHKQTRT